jgi:hypothetical protein
MTETTLPFAIGQTTDAGIFVGMDESGLAVFVHSLYGSKTRCNPSIVKAIAKEQDEERNQRLQNPPSFWESAVVLEGDEAVKAFRSIAGR